MESPRTLRCTLAATLGALAGLIAAFATANAPADSAAWDQKQVTHIADELSSAARRLRNSCRAAPAPIQASDVYENHILILHDVRLIESGAAHLLNELREGKGVGETRPLYEELIERIARTQRETKRARASMQVAKDLEVVDQTARRLAPYYAIE